MKSHRENFLPTINILPLLKRKLRYIGLSKEKSDSSEQEIKSLSHFSRPHKKLFRCSHKHRRSRKTIMYDTSRIHPRECIVFFFVVVV